MIFFYFRSQTKLNQIFMKRFSLILAVVLTTVFVYAQVPRNKVVQEIGTGTWCTYCPGAAMGADDLVANGCQVAVIEYHNGDAFTNTASDARNAYYSISGYPTAHFDGVVEYVGGNHSTSLYTTYLPLYNQRIAIPSAFTIMMTGTNTGDNYNVNLLLNKVSAYTGTNLVAHLVLTESEIAYSWQGQTELNFVERTMVPSHTGTPISFASSTSQVVTLSFTKDPTWVLAHCELVAFIQDNTTKEILQGIKVPLNAIPAPLATSFTASPTTICAPGQVNYTANAPGATTYSWTFPGGNPATSTVANPVVTYSTTGSYGASLVASNATSVGSFSQDNIITVNSLPATPASPMGTTNMCANPGNETYVTTNSPTATSYTWELLPATAGVMTPNGTQCTIDWNNTFTGNASLKVKASNACGDSPFSGPLDIFISTQPGTCGTPTGPASLCQNAVNSDYATTGTTNVTDYIWDLSPASAGTLTPNWTTAVVDWAEGFTGTATIKVRGTNNGCDGAWSNTLSVSVNAGPQVFNITGGGNYCEGTSGAEIGLSGSQSGVNYTLYKEGVATSTVVAGNGSAITFGLQPTGTYTSMATNSSTCSMNMNGNAAAALVLLPATPGQPDGPNTVYTGSTPTSDYVTTGGANATIYAWEVVPAEAGTPQGNGTTVTIQWDLNYLGTAEIKVKGENECGTSTYSSPSYPVAVYNTVGIYDGVNLLFSVYPNPAANQVTIQSNGNQVADINMVNSLGQTVLSLNKVSINGKYNLDLSGVPSGIYQVIFRTQKGEHSVKLFVK